MRAIEHGINAFGKCSYKSGLENIYVFNENIVFDENGEQGFSDNIHEYYEVEIVDDIYQKKVDGDTLDKFEMEYIIDAKVCAYEELGISNVKEFSYSTVQEREVYKINEKYFAFHPISIEEVVIKNKNKKKEKKIIRTPFMQVNDILKEKNMSVILFISTDGAKITRAYQEVTEVFDNEIVLFIEINDKSNYFGSVVRVKSGTNINNIEIFPYKNISKLASVFRTNINEGSFREILKKHVKNKDSNQLYLVKKIIFGIQDVIIFTATLPLRGVSVVSKAIAEGLGELLLKEKRWRYYDEKGKPTAKSELLLPGIEFFKRLKETDTVSKGLPTNNITGNAIEILKDLRESLVLQIKNHKNIEGSEFLFYSSFEKLIKQVLNVIDYFIDFLKNPLEKGVNILEIGFVAFNALVVGIINGLIDAVKGIFELIALISDTLIDLEDPNNLINISSYIELFIEITENQIEVFVNFFSKENLKALFNFFKESIPLLINLPSILLNAASDVTFSIDEIAYYYGYIIGMIIQIIIETMATGGAATVEHAIESLVNSIKGFFKLAGKGISKLDTIIDFLYSLKQQAKKLKPFLDEILEWLRKLLISIKVNILVSYDGQLVNVVLEPISVIVNYALKISKKNWIDDLSKIGLQIGKLNDNLHILVHNGEEVFRGNKKQLKETLEGYLKKGKDLKKFLDELAASLKNFDEIYKTKYFRPTGLYKKLTLNEVLSKFGKRGGELFEVVEKEWTFLQKNLKFGNEKGRKVLVSGMIDKETGKVSKVFSNFTDKEIDLGKHLEFMNELHPTLKKRLTEHIKRARKNGSGLNLDDPDVYKFAWQSMDNAHAEFRALDDILKQIDTKGTLGEEAINRIMGYNSFLRKEGIQHTCADCFYLTYGVTYIK